MKYLNLAASVESISILYFHIETLKESSLLNMKLIILL